MREIKVGFSRFYNKLHNRKGRCRGDGYKSVIVENGEALTNCLAYIDLRGAAENKSTILRPYPDYQVIVISSPLIAIEAPINTLKAGDAAYIIPTSEPDPVVI